MPHLIAVNLVVYNGEKYIRHCLNSVSKQTFRNFEINIWDNASTDKTVEIAEEYSNLFPKFQIYYSPKNIGMWPAHEELWKKSNGKYIVVLSVDVILNSDFIKNAVEAMEKDKNGSTSSPQVGALQGKIYRWKFDAGGEPEMTNIIDTLGFQIYRSRRVVNIGHGESASFHSDNKTREIFGVEGAVPVFRKTALEDCRINKEIVDHNMFWYGDDLDIAWRMRMFGWKEIYCPMAVAYHERSTTHKLSKNVIDFIHTRKTIPIEKRRLDWRNTILTLIKNDYLINIVRDAPAILSRQLKLWIYFTFFEPSMYLELINIAKMLPGMLKKRREIMRKSAIFPGDIRKWFN